MKKYLLVGALLLTLIMTLVACGSENPSGDTDVKNSATDQTETDVPNDSDEPDNTEYPVEPDNTDDPVEPDDTEAPVEPGDTEDPVAEMVDWETWATQSDNDEVCMVVWNETTGTQKILEPRPEGSLDLKKYSYTIQEGDRIAVPKKTSVVCVYVNLDTRLEWEYSENEQYMELEINPGEMTQIDVILNTKDNPSRQYLFNY